jgi:hypothetical protein
MVMAPMVDVPEKGMKSKLVHQSKSEDTVHKDRNMTAQERYGIDRQRKQDENTFGEKLKRFAPLNQEIIQRSGKGHEIYLERIQFEYEPCPEDLRMFDTFSRSKMKAFFIVCN